MNSYKIVKDSAFLWLYDDITLKDFYKDGPRLELVFRRSSWNSMFTSGWECKLPKNWINV